MSLSNTFSSVWFVLSLSGDTRPTTLSVVRMHLCFSAGSLTGFLDPCCEQAVKYATSFSPLTRPPIGRTELWPDTRKQGANRVVWIIRKWKTSCWCAGWARAGGNWQPYLSQKGVECEIARPPGPSHACVGMQMWLTFTARNRRLHPQPRNGLKN